MPAPGGMWPLYVLSAGGLAVLCLGALRRGRDPKLLFGLSLATAFSAAALSLLGGTVPAAPAGLLDTGPFGALFTTFLCGLTGAALLFGHPYAARRGLAGDEFHGLVLWACLGMALTASAASWLVFFLGYELLSLCLYVLVALPRTGGLSGEAGLKYFFVGAIGAAFLAFGIAVLYAATGTLDIAASVADALPAAGASARPWVRLGLAFVLAGASLKLSLVPFHLWAPDVYQGAPAPVTALLASGAKIALFAALLRVALAAGDSLWSVAAPILSVLGALTVAVGNVGALTQPRLKRLLAYSSVAQMGYLALALAAVRSGGGLAAAFYALVYGAMDLGAFGILGALSSPEREGDLDALADLRGVGHTAPWRAAAFTVCLLSLAGMPPTAGFVGKVSIFLAVFRADLAAAGVVALAATVPAAYLYLRVAVTLYSRPPRAARPLPVPEAGVAERIAAGAVAAVLVLLGLLPSPLLTVLGRVLASG